MKKPHQLSLFLSLLLLIIIATPSVLAASLSSLVRLTGGFDGEDYKCEAVYITTPASVPIPMWFWYGQGGSIDNDQGNVLPRSKFSRGQNIMCKYIDPPNNQNLELSTIIPNAPPSIEPMQNMQVKKGKILTLNPIVEDPDGDEVSIIYSEPFDSTGKWEANIQDSIGTYNVTITAIDPFGASDSVNFNVELTDSLVVQRQDYNLQYQNQQIAAQEVQQLGEKRYSKKFTLVKKGTQLELYPDIDPQKSDLSVTRIIFVLNKDKLKVGLDINSLGSITPVGVTTLGGFV